jgi:peptidoglycan hydrolase-like protein with peptidoglycan-binding domain
MSDEFTEPVQEQVTETAPAAEVVEAPQPEVPAVQPQELPEPVAEVFAQPVPTRHVIGSADTDTVYLDKCVYKNMYAKKSLTVHHLQRRLNELGYTDAYSDKDGWYGDLTKSAVASFQAANNLEGDGLMNAATFSAIFAGDANVTVAGE